MKNHGPDNGVFHRCVTQHQPYQEGKGDLHQVPVEQAEEQGGKDDGKALAKGPEALQNGSPEQQLLHHRRHHSGVQHHARRAVHVRGLEQSLHGGESPPVEQGFHQGGEHGGENLNGHEYRQKLPKDRAGHGPAGAEDVPVEGAPLPQEDEQEAQAGDHQVTGAALEQLSEIVWLHHPVESGV